MDDGLRVHEHVDHFCGHVEEVMRLDDLEALVHQRGGIDRDLRTHRPVGMAQGLLRRCGADRLRRPGTEWAAGGGQHDAMDIFARAGGERLENGIVLGIDRQDGSARRRGTTHEQRAGADQRFLVGERDDRAALGGGERGP